MSKIESLVSTRYDSRSNYANIYVVLEANMGPVKTVMAPWLLADIIEQCVETKRHSLSVIIDGRARNDDHDAKEKQKP